VPKFTNVELTKDVIIDLASHENIIGIKQSDPSGVPDTAEILAAVDTNNFGIISGSVGFMKKQQEMGAIGCIGAVVNILPRQSCKVYDTSLSEAKRGELEAALGKVHNRICAEYGVPGLKHAMDLVGFKGGFCREPLLPLRSREKADIQQVLDNFHTKDL